MKKQIKTEIRINGNIDIEGLTQNLMEGIRRINEDMKKLNVPEEVLDREVKPFGNASHIILPEKYKGKKAKVIIKK